MRKEVIDNILFNSLYIDPAGNKLYTMIEGFLTTEEKNFIIINFGFNIKPLGIYNQIIFTENIKQPK